MNHQEVEIIIELHAQLKSVLERVRQIEQLVNDEWNVDDTICQQNMKKIQQILTGQNNETK
jgi:hypothetical protein